MKKILIAVNILMIIIALLCGCGEKNTLPQSAVSESSASLESSTVPESSDASECSTVPESNDVVNCIVCIRGKDKIGSGVIYEMAGNQMIVVTAAHVVDGQDAVNVDLITDMDSPKEITYKVKKENIEKVSDLDLAFLKIEDDHLQEVKYVVDTKLSVTEETLFVLGYDGEGKWQESTAKILFDWIYVEDFKSHMMLLEADTVEGMSGGGFFDSQGEFLGIICGKDSQNKVAVLPAQVIAAEYSVSRIDK